MERTGGKPAAHIMVSNTLVFKHHKINLCFFKSKWPVETFVDVLMKEKMFLVLWGSFVLFFNDSVGRLHWCLVIMYVVFLFCEHVTLKIDLQIAQPTTYIVCHVIVMEQVLYQNMNWKAVIFFYGYRSALVCDKVCCLRTTIHMPLHWQIEMYIETPPNL